MQSRIGVYENGFAYMLVALTNNEDLVSYMPRDVFARNFT